MLVMIDNYDSFTYNLVQYLGFRCDRGIQREAANFGSLFGASEHRPGLWRQNHSRQNNYARENLAHSAYRARCISWFA